MEQIVAVGIIVNENKQILIAKRPMHKHLGGYWEFPGGKVEQHESVLQALQRELYEELTIRVSKAEPLFVMEHSYADKDVCLEIWRVMDYCGNPRGSEGQLIQWVTVDELPRYRFPEANQAIIDHLCLSISVNHQAAS